MGRSKIGSTSFFSDRDLGNLEVEERLMWKMKTKIMRKSKAKK
jgi:hypothetical protein